MKIIVPAIKLGALLCVTRQSPARDFRLSSYCLRVPCADGELLYQTLTGELLLLNGMEAQSYGEANLIEELARRGFLVPRNYDEHALATQARVIAKLLVKPVGGLQTYVIFPTTDCNARCAYCYERGRSKGSMSKVTASQVAAYILRTKSHKTASLRWFGGEPLCNTDVIDTITTKLNAERSLFRSSMATNGYSFDEDLVRHAHDCWNLESVQIPLDGTEATYNRVKNYVGGDSNSSGSNSPYIRVLHNIELLATAGIDVEIRLNLTRLNFDDMSELAIELAARFKGCNKVSAYAALVGDFTNGSGSRSQGECEADTFARYAALQDSLRVIGIGKARSLRRSLVVNQCMADNDASVTILPDGRLGKCEHESEGQCFGSVFSSEQNEQMIDSWKETIICDDCYSCSFYPQCIKLKKCAWHKEGCTELSRMIMRYNMEQAILGTYEKAKAVQKNIKRES